MLVSLYTVRVVLNTLGVIDYGIFNVVGGIVVMFSFLSNTMASASQRFFAFELGQNNILQLKKTFSITMIIYAMIAVIILILAETAGLWFLNTQMTIPLERMNAANWVYQFSVFSFMMTMFAIPYNAAIIAHERMNVYAYVSIIEVIFKLIIVYLLVLFSFDKLKLYAVLIFIVTTILTFIYRTYCKRKFTECRFSFYWEKSLFKKIVSYSGWNLFGATAGIFKEQGINILLNVFFNPVVNAARGIAYQVNNAINQFATNFFTAVSPQIIKYYAAGEKEKMKSLVFQSSKFSYFLLFMLSMPVLLETNFILSIWLKIVPDYLVLFTRLIIVNALMDSLSGALVTSALATGKIKQYQIIVGGTLLLNFPVSYFFLKMGFPPQSTMYVAIVIAIINLLLRLIMLQKMIGLSIKKYAKDVLFVVALVSFLSCFIPLLIFFNMEDSWVRFLIVGIASLLSTGLVIYFIGINYKERRYISQVIKNNI